MNYHEMFPKLSTGLMFTRMAWGGQAFIYMMPGSNGTVAKPPLSDILPEGTQLQFAPQVCMVFNGTSAPWNPDTVDQLAIDWHEVRMIDRQLVIMHDEIAPDPDLVKQAAPDATYVAPKSDRSHVVL